MPRCIQQKTKLPHGTQTGTSQVPVAWYLIGPVDAGAHAKPSIAFLQNRAVFDQRPLRHMASFGSVQQTFPPRSFSRRTGALVFL